MCISSLRHCVHTRHVCRSLYSSYCILISVPLRESVRLPILFEGNSRSGEVESLGKGRGENALLRVAVEAPLPARAGARGGGQPGAHVRGSSWRGDGEPAPLASREAHCHLVVGLRSARWDRPQWASTRQLGGRTRRSASLRVTPRKVGMGS